jgi:hypothetical protein
VNASSITRRPAAVSAARRAAPPGSVTTSTPVVPPREAPDILAEARNDLQPILYTPNALAELCFTDLAGL